MATIPENSGEASLVPPTSGSGEARIGLAVM